MIGYPKVAFVAGTLGVGGAERQLYFMVRELVANGAEPEVLTLTRGEHWESAFAELGVPLHYVGRFRSRLVRTLVIARLLRRLQPDIVQSAHSFPNFYVAVGAKFAGARSLGAVREDVADLQAQLGRIGDFLYMSTTQYMVVNSQKAVDELVARGREKTVCHLPNVVDTTHFAPRPRACCSREFVVLTVGRLEINKGHDRFLRVMRRLIDQAPAGTAVRGVIIGEGRQRDALRALAQDLGLLEQLTMSTTHDPLAHYQSADIFLLTSDAEGTPNVVLEAMATGLPVISFDVGDVPGIITNGIDGYVVPRGDEDAVADVALRLMHDPRMRVKVGMIARTTIVENWSHASLGRHLSAMYDRVAELSST